MAWNKVDDNLYVHDKAPFGLIKIDSVWEVYDLRDKSKFIEFTDIFNNPVFPVDFSNSDLTVKSLNSLGSLNGLTSNFMPIGTIIQSIRDTAPSGFLLCNGAEYLFSNYLDLFSALPIVTNTITFTIASPCVVTWNSHGLATGQSIQFSTTGALPTFSVFQAVYYIRKIDSNTFHLYTTLSNAMNINSTTGRINTSGTQSGIHTGESYLYGNGNGTTTFNIPDLRGASPRGAGTSTGYIQSAILTLGEKTDDQFQGHYHGTVSSRIGGSALLAPGSGYEWTNGSEIVGSPTTDGTNGTPRTGTETRAKTQAVNFYIKY